MTDYPPRYWHGGAPGLKPGDLITPRPNGDHRHLVKGCRVCEARRRNEILPEDDNDPTMIYVTTERDYARLYAHGYPRGSLYRVQPRGQLTDRADHDLAPSWGCASARVMAVYDAYVVLSRKQVVKLIYELRAAALQRTDR